MKSYEQFEGKIKTLFCDIDDTLTSEGQLKAPAYSMLWKLAEQGVEIVPVTGRPAGWCEMIARLWPVKAVVGENGAFYFTYKDKTMKRVFAQEEALRLQNQKQLRKIEEEVLQKIPGAALASDQFCRLFDLAIDFCEDVPPLKAEDIHKITSIFEKHGAVAKVSSIHVNGWFGDHSKKSMCKTFYEEEYGQSLAQGMDTCAFVGDSPNDESMFAHFDNAFAVANIKDFLDDLKAKPKYLIPKEGGEGFVLLGRKILENNN